MNRIKKYHKLAECLYPFPDNNTLELLTSEERELVKIINEYSERNLFRLFSRDKNVKEFIEKVSAVNLEKFIKPYIERRIYKCISICRSENIPVYLHRPRIDTLHYEDLIEIIDENAEPVFRFTRDEEQSTYNLSLESKGKPIDLKKKTIEIICLSPCILRDDHNIHFVSNVDGSKIKPFLSKDYIIIPKKTELQYFGGFVQNTINTYKVTGTGFKILELMPEKRVIIDLESGLNGKPVLILSYDYNKNKILANEQSSSFTTFNSENDNFVVFIKYKRDFNWEREVRDTLGELGFFSDDDITFFPISGTGKKEIDNYQMVEILSHCYTDFSNAGFILNSRLDTNYNLKPVNLEIKSQVEKDCST